MMPFNGYGSYLVRYSETIPGNYALSVRDRERVRHYRINTLSNGTFFVTMRATFKTIVDLVTYYQQQADGLCINLITPCALSEKPQTAGLLRQANKEWETDRRQIRKLESSEFVEVWEGLWNGTTPTAVNTPKLGRMATVDFL